jgi:hypothetical protein
LKIPYTMLQCLHYTPLLLRGGGGVVKVNPLVYATVNSKEKNSSDFCPKYVLEFGSWSGLVQYARNIQTMISYLGVILYPMLTYIFYELFRPLAAITV